jgi:hypothetical protein
MEEPLKEIAEEGVSSKREDTPQQTEPQRAPSPVPQPVKPEPHRSNRMRRAPIQDDDECFERTFYHKNITKTIGEVMPAQANRAEITDEPPAYKAAMSSPEAAQWQIACMEELQSLQDMKVYKEVPQPLDRKVVDSKWTFRLK